MILSAVHSKQWDQRAEQRWRWRKQDRAAPRPQGFIVSMSEWLEPCAGVLGVSASYIRSAFPTPSNRPLRPRLRAYRRVALDFRTTADNIFDLIANFPTHFNHRFCKPKVGSSILSTGTSKKSLRHRRFLHFWHSYFPRQKSPKTRFGCIFGCSRDPLGNAGIYASPPLSRSAFANALAASSAASLLSRSGRRRRARTSS